MYKQKQHKKQVQLTVQRGGVGHTEPNARIMLAANKQ
jgi:hypothetical protein